MRIFSAFAGTAMGLAAWRNAPGLVRDRPQIFAVVCLVVVLGLWFGRRPGGATAVAVAEGGNAIGNVVQVHVHQDGAPSAGRGMEGLDSLPWIDTDARPAIDGDELAELVAAEGVLEDLARTPAHPVKVRRR